MHLCIVTETFPPEVNGVAMTLERLVRELIGLGHEASVIRPAQAEDASPENALRPFEETLVKGIPIPKYQGLQFGLPQRGKILRRWRKAPPDLVYVATEGPLGLAAISACKHLKIPAVSGFHTNFDRYLKHYLLPGTRWLGIAYLRWVHNRTRATFAPSADTVASLQAYGLRDVKLFSRGVDTELFDPRRRDPGLRKTWGSSESRDDLVAVYVSRLAAEKNLPFAVKSFQKIMQDVDRAKGVFVGDGPERRPLAERHPEFIYAGMQKGEALARHYAAADLFVFPSLTETFGNVVTEAMASGLVVVAFDYAAPRQLIRDGENGFLAEFGNEADFLRALERALEARPRWPEIQRAARTTAESISWNRIVGDFAIELEKIRMGMATEIAPA